MNTDIALVEETLQQYLPVLQEIYSKDRRDKTAIKQVIDRYQEMITFNNTIVALFDNRRASVLYVSNNFENITGYKASTAMNWSSLFFFKILHPSHYSYPFVTLRNEKKIFKQLSPMELKKSVFFVGGLKLIDGHNRTRLSFMKAKPLLKTAAGHPDLTIVYAEDVTHLMKSSHYWLRYESASRKQAYVNQRGKKQFNDLISDGEFKILQLVADKKSTAEIADELFLSKLTVETHRKNMIRRVGAVDSTALVHLCKMANIL